MDRIAVETTQVLVVADGDSTAAVSNKRGHLFEQFVAQLLGALGYEEPRTDRLNVTSDGIEIDVEARQKVTGHALIAECKTYSANVRAELLSAFLGKYGVRRMKDPNLVGLFVALPRLTANGVEHAREAEAVYDGFRHLGSYEVVELLEKWVLHLGTVASVADRGVEACAGAPSGRAHAMYRPFGAGAATVPKHRRRGSPSGTHCTEMEDPFLRMRSSYLPTIMDHPRAQTSRW